ncbi:MAG: type II toxin-antitoxin system HicA family toxin [Mycobacteriales bacterium]
MSGRLPVVSGDELISALGKLGWVVARQRGSHVRLRHPERAVPLVDETRAWS